MLEIDVTVADLSKLIDVIRQQWVTREHPEREYNVRCGSVVLENVGKRGRLTLDLRFPWPEKTLVPKDTLAAIGTIISAAAARDRQLWEERRRSLPPPGQYKGGTC